MIGYGGGGGTTGSSGHGVVGNGGSYGVTAGVGGYFTGGSGTGFNNGLFGDGIDAYAGYSAYADAGYFEGEVYIDGDLEVEYAKNFKIDHPLDPANKYLVHASVESSEMMNIYTGNVTTDPQGEAKVQLPDWFEVLNTDFRYQLTVIGQFAQAIVARKIENNRFEIKTNVPSLEVSWQVTGVRQDPAAKARPMVVEQEKEPPLKGFYIHPEFYGQPAEKKIAYARHPELMKPRQKRPMPPRPAIRPAGLVQSAHAQAKP